MSGVILDAGALVALDRGRRQAWVDLDTVQRAGLPVVVPASVVAQVWRDGAVQARLARVLTGSSVVPLTQGDARAVGVLCGRAGTADIVDAHVIVVAVRTGSRVLTSHVADLRRLAEAAGEPVRLVPV